MRLVHGSADDAVCAESLVSQRPALPRSAQPSLCVPARSGVMDGTRAPTKAQWVRHPATNTQHD